MSRTWHHGDKAKRRLFEGGAWDEPYVSILEYAPRKAKRSSSRWFWMSTPSWWIRCCMTVKQRAQTRILLRKTERLHDYEDAPLFPLAKKPHEYYY